MTDGIEPAKPKHPWVPLALATAGVLAWLWPIGLGGKMPVGGDVTQFSIGLMAELGRAIRAGRIPFWNDLWGYGFPGLAESQMGVYYLPHLLAYGLLSVEVAYVLLLVAHTLWATWGGYWASRQFGASRSGAAVSGFAFATCGFFLVHLPHQWGASTACWMPWAWGLAWRVSRGKCGPRSRLLLAAVLAIQILPGHFQLAFITEVTTCFVGAVGLLGNVDGAARWKRALGFGLSLLAVLPLALMQLAPTAELAALAKAQRTVDYLGAFASPPTHLISYVAPGLFHQSPLWRPLAWDVFHAMPEEHLATIGLVPLFLAILALRQWREPATIALIVAVLVATIFSLGPYVPGFSTYCQWPGFSFFRAPGRWGAGAMLALSLLAGLGFDAVGTLLKPARSLRRCALIAGILLGAVVGLIELALVATEPVGGKPKMPEVARVLEGMFTLLPWAGDPSLMSRMAEMHRPSNDSRVPIALARQGIIRPTPAELTLAKSRGGIYATELGPTLLVLGGMFILSFLPGWPRFLAVGLLVLMAVEAGMWSRMRVFDLGPIQDLRVQSPVLGELAKLPRGTRSIDGLQNLSMVAGVSAVQAYRTLDLPILPEITMMAGSPGTSPETTQAARSIGLGVLVTQPGSFANPTDWTKVATVEDPTLIGWLSSEGIIKSLTAQGMHPGLYEIWKPMQTPVRACFLTREHEQTLLPIGQPGGLRAVVISQVSPEHLAVAFDAPEPGTFLNMSLHYPRWRATLNGNPVPVEKRFGCQAVSIPASGHYVLELRYDASRDWTALAISGVAWMGWIVVYGRSLKRQEATSTGEQV